MTRNRIWRNISTEEAEMVGAIVSGSGVPEGQPLLDDLPGAMVLQDSVWIYEVKTPNNRAGVAIPNGLFPARAFVPDRASYRGEILLWVKDGHLSALEYAWVTDEAPTRWPTPDEMEIVAQ